MAKGEWEEDRPPCAWCKEGPAWKKGLCRDCYYAALEDAQTSRDYLPMIHRDVEEL